MASFMNIRLADRDRADLSSILTKLTDGAKYMHDIPDLDCMHFFLNTIPEHIKDAFNTAANVLSEVGLKDSGYSRCIPTSDSLVFRFNHDNYQYHVNFHDNGDDDTAVPLAYGKLAEAGHTIPLFTEDYPELLQYVNYMKEKEPMSVKMAEADSLCRKVLYRLTSLNQVYALFPSLLVASTKEEFIVSRYYGNNKLREYMDSKPDRPIARLSYVGLDKKSLSRTNDVNKPDYTMEDIVACNQLLTMLLMAQAPKDVRRKENGARRYEITSILKVIKEVSHDDT